jgi:hypothetical protein
MLSETVDAPLQAMKQALDFEQADVSFSRLAAGGSILLTLSGPPIGQCLPVPRVTQTI